MIPPDQPFSRRFGHRPADAEIIVREDAPPELRGSLVMLVQSLGFSAKYLRSEICQVLLKTPDRDNWSDGNVFDEARLLIENCPWFRVYDIAEAFHASMNHYDPENATAFQERLNDIFVENGIGWAMENGRIVARGSEAFTLATRDATSMLIDAGRGTAANEIHEALADISRRPKADESGAIQHAMAALECVARDVTGEPNKTLGAIISQLGLPKPLDAAIDKLWGYTSIVGRHLQEGRPPTFDEAELVVTIACGVSSYLSRRASNF